MRTPMYVEFWFSYSEKPLLNREFCIFCSIACFWISSFLKCICLLLTTITHMRLYFALNFCVLAGLGFPPGFDTNNASIPGSGVRILNFRSLWHCTSSAFDVGSVVRDRNLLLLRLILLFQSPVANLVLGHGKDA